MQIITGNIWDYKDKGIIVIPTNLVVKKNGEAVMGKGLALQAAQRVPGLAKKYGSWLTKHRNLGVIPPFAIFEEKEYKLILLPTKYDWSEASDYDLIFYGIEALSVATDTIYLPKLGCGEGLLPEELIITDLQKFLPTDNFILVNNAEVKKETK